MRVDAKWSFFADVPEEEKGHEEERGIEIVGGV